MQKRLPIGNLLPQSIENRAALRTAFAAVIAVLLSFKFHLQNPFWSGMTVVVVANLYTGSILDKAIMRVIGTIIGAVCGYFIAGFVANSLFLFLASCFLIIAICAYFYQYSNYGYAYLLGAICAFIVICQIVFSPENALYVAIWRPIEIGTGVVVFALCAYLLFPNHLKENITNDIAIILGDLGKQMDDLMSYLTFENTSLDTLIADNLKLKRQLRKLTELMGAVSHELGVKRKDVERFRMILDSLSTLTRQVHYLWMLKLQKTDIQKLKFLPLELVVNAIKKDLAALQLQVGTENTERVCLQAVSAVQAFEDAYDALHKDRAIRSELIDSLALFFQQTLMSLSLLASAFSYQEVSIKKEYQVLSKQYRLRYDVSLIQYAIKAGLTVLLALGFWFLSNWPGGINGLISSLIISVRKNTFEMKNIVVYRLIGCSLGAGVALLSLYLFELGLISFTLLLFLSVYGFSYGMFRYPKYAYIGLQASIAFIIALAQEGGPPTSLAPPLERLSGVLIGIAASFIVANVFWRTDAWSTLSRYLEKIQRFHLYNVRQILTPTDGPKTLHDLATLFWNTRELIDGLANSKLTEKNQKRLEDIRLQFGKRVQVQVVIQYFLSAVDYEQVMKTATNLSFNLNAYSAEVVSFIEKQDADGAKAFLHTLQEAREQMDAHFIQAEIPIRERRNFLGYLDVLAQLAGCVL